MTQTQTRQPRTLLRRPRTRSDRLEIYFEEGTVPNARRYRWRMRSGANGQQLGKSHDGFSQRDRCLANARTVTGYDLANDPTFTEAQPGIDGEVAVWLVDPRSRRGFPG